MKKATAPLVGMLIVLLIWICAKNVLSTQIWGLGIMMGIFAILVLVIRLLDEY